MFQVKLQEKTMIETIKFYLEKVIEMDALI